MSEIKTARSSNFELLRIVSMLMIVGLHYFNPSMGGALKNVTQGTPNYYIMNLCESIFIVSVNCFVLITGFFSISKKQMSIRKSVDLYIMMIFYTIVFYIITVLLNVNSFSVKSLLKAAFPFFFGNHWFVQTYIILMLISPFLNCLLNTLSKKAYKSLIILELLIFSITYTFLPNPPASDGGYGITNFIILYSIAGYIKLHYQKKKSSGFYFLIFLVCAIIITGMSLSMLRERAFGYINIFNIIGGVSLFMCFKEMNIGSNRFINYIAGFTFGVYLIHTDTSLLEIMYQKILKCSMFWDSPWLIVHAIISVIFLYAVCTIIDIARKWIFDRTVNPVLDRIKPINHKISAD